MCGRLVKQVGGASADAQSYGQGRFAVCALVDCSFGMVARETVGALPQTPPEALPLDSARGNFPLDPFRAIQLVSLSYFSRVLLLFTTPFPLPSLIPNCFFTLLVLK